MEIHMAESVISSVLRTLGNLVIKETIFLRGVPDQVESMKRELRSMQGFLRDADLKQREGDNSAAILIQDIRYVAYEVENVVAKIDWMQRWNSRKKGFLGTISRYTNVFRGHLKRLHEAGKKIEKLQKRIDEIFQRKDRYDLKKLGETSGDKDGIDHSMEDDLNMQRMVSPYFECKDDVIGFDNELEKIIEELIDPLNLNKELTFVSLVGMGGIGKSTLARKVFNDPKIKQCFDTTAWISVSQNYKPVELLKAIMKKTMNIEIGNLTNQGRNENEMSEDELREKLHEFLKNKKYLIVQDDVWTNKALDQISYNNMVFPDMNNGSRIILTTRNLTVAEHTSCTNHIHKLQPLDEEISWDFFRKKAFRLPNQVNENTLKELESLGKQLAKKCNGLPLALSVLGGILSKNMDLNNWSKMVNNLDWGETNSEKNVEKIVALSFHDLSYNLKSCFLYMAYFPEDYLISASRLIQMWVAEGFIPFNSKCSHEETARKCLYELAQRSMIQVVETSKAHGWIELIRIHDILRDFVIAESTKIGFLKLCNSQGDFEACTSDGMTTYRLSFNKFYRNKVGVHIPNLRTFIGFNLIIQPSFSGLNYLRVLELVNIENIISLPDEIGRMIFLRYIGLRKCGSLIKGIVIPSTFEKLMNLQTFDAKDSPIKSFPPSMWKITTLKHVYMDLRRSNYCKIMFPKHGELLNVQTLDLWLHTNMVLEMKGFNRTLEAKSKLFSLHLYYLDSPLETLLALSRNCSLLELDLRGTYTSSPSKNISFPSKNISSPSIRRLPNNTLFPPNLRKLNLCFIYISEDPMPILGQLPSLVVLELYNAYAGERMSCSAGGFRRLQDLTIGGFDHLREWKVERNSMPVIARLSLSSCPKLMMQAEELVHLPALKELELYRMPNFPKEKCDKLKEVGCKVIVK